jgi:formamidopyrimidine-DNA glycosylase
MPEFPDVAVYVKSLARHVEGEVLTCDPVEFHAALTSIDQKRIHLRLLASQHRVAQE